MFSFVNTHPLLDVLQGYITQGRSTKLFQKPLWPSSVPCNITKCYKNHSSTAHRNVSVSPDGIEETTPSTLDRGRCRAHGQSFAYSSAASSRFLSLLFQHYWFYEVASGSRPARRRTEKMGPTLNKWNKDGNNKQTFDWMYPQFS